MRPPPVAALLAALIIAGCTTAPDWIDRTLVTVDVTGQWHGTTLAKSGGASMQPEVWLDLQQHGPKVTGAIRSRGFRYPPRDWLPIEGTIAGDVLTFTERNGAGQGRLTVTGDEMNGDVTMGDSMPFSLQRTGSGPGPNSR
ncbi:MAG TPA: hypothetical protein VIG37_27065 [Methylomirabilota bacterium]|jgi:hypothetical protein